MSYHQVTVSGHPGIALRSELVELIVVPTLGAKISNLRRRNGREWLWRNDQMPFQLPQPGAGYVETADSGGWDECFPTVGPCPMPGVEGLTLPDHGELWSGEWTCAVFQSEAGTSFTGTCHGRLLPYEFSRVITLDPVHPVVRFQYQLTHRGDGPGFPFLWSAHPLLNIQPGSLLTLPSVHQVRIDQVHGREGTRNDVVGWPLAGGGGSLALPGPDAGWAMKLFGDVGASGLMVLTDPRRGERLEIVVRPEDVPQVGIWINAGGWAPEGRRPYYNLALEPCIGAPDRLDQAVEEWQTAGWLEAGSKREWSLMVWLLEEDERR